MSAGRVEEQEWYVVRMSQVGFEFREMLAPRPWRNPCLQIFAKTKHRTEISLTVH